MLIYPQRNHRTGLTLSGLLLVALSIAMGIAAYNAANNILFLTLSLMLACIILSGVLSWLNFRGLVWRIEVQPPMRAGQEHPIVLVVRNQKSFLPSYGLWFEVRLASSDETRELALRTRLDAGAEQRLETVVHPLHRGRDRVELTFVGSYFPFGFLRKGLSVQVVEPVIVWPAAVEYRRFSVSASHRWPADEYLKRAGQSGDLLSLRPYQLNDSHRQIHWKASARLRQLMVRQLSTESGDGYSIWVDTTADSWARPEQFETLCSFAATLAEDLFTAGKLRAAAVGHAAPVSIRKVRDLELFLDALACAERRSTSRPWTPDETAVFSSHRSTKTKCLLTFVPDGALGVAAYLHGERAASA